MCPHKTAALTANVISCFRLISWIVTTVYSRRRIVHRAACLRRIVHGAGMSSAHSAQGRLIFDGQCIGQACAAAVPNSNVISKYGGQRSLGQRYGGQRSTTAVDHCYTSPQLQWTIATRRHNCSGPSLHVATTAVDHCYTSPQLQWTIAARRQNCSGPELHVVTIARGHCSRYCCRLISRPRNVQQHQDTALVAVVGS